MYVTLTHCALTPVHSKLALKLRHFDWCIKLSASSEMDVSKKEQRSEMRFLFAEGLTAKEIHDRFMTMCMEGLQCPGQLCSDG